MTIDIGGPIGNMPGLDHDLMFLIGTRPGLDHDLMFSSIFDDDYTSLGITPLSSEETDFPSKTSSSESEDLMLNRSDIFTQASTVNNPSISAIANTPDIIRGKNPDEPEDDSLLATPKQPIPDPAFKTQDAGNTSSRAQNLGALKDKRTIAGNVGGRDTADWFYFDVEKSTTLSVKLEDMVADADVFLYSLETGSRIASSVEAGSTSESISIEVNSGIYYVKVDPYGSAVTNYTLVLTDTSTVQPSPPQATFDSVYGYGLVDAAAAVAAAQGSSDPLPAVTDRGGSDWALDLINAPEVWAQGYTGEGIVVAVVDTGVDYLHDDLKANIWTNSGEISGNGIDDDGNGYVDDVRGWDFAYDDNNPMDNQSHGTHVAGTIAAANNGFGVTGVAYDASIMAVKVLGDNGSGRNNDVAAGIRYAADNGADVINLSLGGGYSSSVESAVEYATQQGAVVVMAAGNEGANQPSYPASFATRWGISVGAVDRNSQIASFSNLAGTDDKLDHVVAPGVGIKSTVLNNGYASYNGTSMATPHVAGVAALILSANPNLTPNEVENLLIGTAS